MPYGRSQTPRYPWIHPPPARRGDHPVESQKNRPDTGFVVNNFAVNQNTTSGTQPAAADTRRVFIVHGHDEATREAVARLVEQSVEKLGVRRPWPSRRQDWLRFRSRTDGQVRSRACP